MTATLAQILTGIRKRGNLTSTVRFPDDLLTPEAQAAFAEGYELIESVNSGFFDTTSTVTTTAGVAFVALPTGTWIVRAVDRAEGVDFVPVPKAGVKDRNRYGSTRGRPCEHRLTARGIDLYPTPDATYTLRVTYTPVAPTLDTTAREFYNSWEEYTIYGALVRLYDNMERDSSKWQKQLDRQAARIIAAASRRDSSGPEYVNLHEGRDDDDDHPDRWRPGY